MDREFLRSQGVEEEKIDGIMKKYGESVQGLKTEKTKLETDISKLNQDIKTKDNEIQTLTSKANDADTYKQRVTDLETELNDKKEKLGELTKTEKMNHAIELAIVRANPRSEELVDKLIDRDKVTVEVDDEGNVTEVKGVEEQIDSIKETYDYLFPEGDGTGAGEGDGTGEGDGSGEGDDKDKSGSSYDPGGIKGNKGKQLKDGELGKSFAERIYGKKEE